MALTLLIVVNVALVAAIVLALIAVMTSFARLTHHQPAVSIPAPGFGTVATDLPQGPGLIRVSRAAQSVGAPARASVRT